MVSREFERSMYRTNSRKRNHRSLHLLEFDPGTDLRRCRNVSFAALRRSSKVLRSGGYEYLQFAEAVRIVKQQEKSSHRGNRLSTVR